MCRIRLCAVLLGLAGGASSATATPYWIDWEGDDFPENQGWTRVWGNWEGQYHGPGAYRTLENGVLTYDSLYDAGVYDYSILHRPGQVDPGPGEVFVMEWRLKVDQVVGYMDPGVGVSSDGAWAFALHFAYDRMYSDFENYLVIPFAPGVFHEYRFVSPDMRTYDLYIDGELARHGAFRHLVGPSEITWGEGVQGATSLHEWDFFRFGVVPEPQALLLVVMLGACCVRGRIRR